MLATHTTPIMVGKACNFYASRADTDEASYPNFPGKMQISSLLPLSLLRTAREVTSYQSKRRQPTKLANGFYLTTNSWLRNPLSHRNSCAICAGPGKGKTFLFIFPAEYLLVKPRARILRTSTYLSSFATTGFWGGTLL